MSPISERASTTVAADTRSRSNQMALREREVSLVDVLDRLLGSGVVLTGDLTLAIADVDLVRISLRALICSVGAEQVNARSGTTDVGRRP